MNFFKMFLIQWALNGSETLRLDSTSGYNDRSKKGYVGLSYSKIRELIFDYFSLHELEMLNLRNASDYLRYVHLGGRLTVLNTNGYPGYIANRLVDSQEVKETKTINNF